MEDPVAIAWLLTAALCGVSLIYKDPSVQTFLYGTATNADSWFVSIPIIALASFSTWIGVKRIEALKKTRLTQLNSKVVKQRTPTQSVSEPFNTKNPAPFDPAFKRNLERRKSRIWAFLIVGAFFLADSIVRQRDYAFAIVLLTIQCFLAEYARRTHQQLEKLGQRLPIVQFNYLFSKKIGNINPINIHIYFDLPPEFNTPQLQQRLIVASEAAFYKTLSSRTALPSADALRMIVLNGVADIVHELKIPVLNARVVDTNSPQQSPSPLTEDTEFKDLD